MRGLAITWGDHEVRTRALGVAAVLVATLSLTGCGWFGGGHKSSGHSTSVFDVKPGECFDPPKTVKSELSSLNRVGCDKPHTQESYAIVNYAAPDGAAVSAYPGDAALTTFAQGACAQQFTGYVGVDYLDSKLFFTYLLPSARSWEQADDRKVICFVTTTGSTLTASVKGTKK